MNEQELKEISKLYKNTLPGAVASYIKKKQDVSIEELISFLKENYSKLRNPIGGRYKGVNYTKILQGLLSDPVFELRDGYIHLNVIINQDDIYEEFKAKKMNSVAYHKQKFRNRVKFPTGTSSQKISDKIFMIENFCGRLNQDPDFYKIFNEPFKVIFT